LIRAIKEAAKTEFAKNANGVKNENQIYVGRMSINAGETTERQTQRELAPDFSNTDLANCQLRESHPTKSSQ
jgi:hypothetical protein